MARCDWQKQQGLCSICSYRAEEDFIAEMQNWLEIDGLTGQVGRMRAAVSLKRNQQFGQQRWGLGWRFQGRVINRVEALALYEEAYFLYLQVRPDLLDWICSIASEVYDNSVSNIESGLDYSIQETDATHLQDISIRRCLVRLGRKFAGDHPVQVRGHDTEGHVLNPGQVPFHCPEEIEHREKAAWWKPESVEAFWQHNKVLLVHPDALTLQPLFLGREGLWAGLDERMALLISRDDRKRLQAKPIKVVRTYWSGVKRSERRHQKILNAPFVSYKELERISLPPSELSQPGRVSWSELFR